MVKNCTNCSHQRVCKYCEQYEQYQKEMGTLIKKWGEDNPFGFTTNCPEWSADFHTGITRDTKPKSDIAIGIEQERNATTKREPKATYDWKTEDEIMTTKTEEGKQNKEEYLSDKYDLIKELDKIMKQNGVLVF